MSQPAWAQPDEPKPAPGALLLVQSFVNTRNLDLVTDLLADADTAGPWLRDAGLLGPGDAPGAGELDIVREVREGIRALLAFNGGALPARAAAPASRTSPAAPVAPAHKPGMDSAGPGLAALETIAGRSRLRLSLARDGRFLLGPEPGAGVTDRLAGLLLIIRDAQRDGTWARLKVCGNDECLWAFYDRSHSRRGAWCDMASCGNLIKNRNLRARRTTHARH
jgi:hypothetical protein